jgi:hypothetical protein
LRRLLLLLAGLLSASPVRAQPRIEPSLLDYAARALASLLETAREQAIANGVKPLPPAVYRGLLGYFPAGLLQKARYAVGYADGISLPALAFTYGDATAMTLGDVVVFRNERTAQTDLKLWAHELTHVMQYQRWGMDGFASHYVRESADLEREAYSNADRFADWHARAVR